MRLRFVAVAALLFGSLGIAHADTMNTFNLSATLINGSATGTLTLNATTGSFTDSSIKVVTSGGTTYFSGAPTSSSGTGYSSIFFATTTPSLFDFQLALPAASLKGYAGGSLCTTTAPCFGDAAGVQAVGAADLDDVTAGTLTLAPAVGVTPEPSSLLLLGTGVLVLGTFLKRRPS